MHACKMDRSDTAALCGGSRAKLNVFFYVTGPKWREFSAWATIGACRCAAARFKRPTSLVLLPNLSPSSRSTPIAPSVAARTLILCHRPSRLSLASLAVASQRTPLSGRGKKVVPPGCSVASSFADWNFLSTCRNFLCC